jgi:hypothetical protein
VALFGTWTSSRRHAPRTQHGITDAIRGNDATHRQEGIMIEVTAAEAENKGLAGVGFRVDEEGTSLSVKKFPPIGTSWRVVLPEGHFPRWCGRPMAAKEM